MFLTIAILTVAATSIIVPAVAIIVGKIEESKVRRERRQWARRNR